MANPALAVDGLTVVRGTNVVLNNVSFEVSAGECVALVGTNGAGKSTLLDAIAGGLRPRSGAVRIGGTDVTRADPRAVAALRVAVHPGARACFPDLTVDEHLTLTAQYTDAAPSVAADDLYAMYPRLAGRRTVEAGALSGGERHLLGFALVTMRQPELLLVDELSLGLAPDMLEELIASLSAFRSNGTTIVVVDQRLEHLAPVADRAVFLERGEIRYDGSVKRLLRDKAILRPVLSAGRVSAKRPRRSDEGANPLLVDNVSVAYGATDALTAVSLAVRAGEVVGVVGGNGAGKTTLLDAITGHVSHRGTVALHGHDVSALSPAERSVRGLARSFQAGSGIDALTVRDCLALAQDRNITPRSLVAASLGLPAAAVAETDVMLRAELLAANAGILEWLDTPCGDLSTGIRRRLELHMAAAHGPSVLLLDEPTSGVAATEINAIVAIVRELADRGAAIVVVDHDHAFISQVADRVTELVDGKVHGGKEVHQAN